MARLSDFPPRLRASTEHPEIIYTRAANYYAVQGGEGSAKRDAVLSLNDGKIAVYEGQPKPDDDVSAVYQSGSALAVPTGRVFVRFADGVDAKDRRDELKRSGYTIDQVPAYAPNAAWLKRADDDIAAALNGIGALEKLSSVENVEPQLLSPRALR